MNTRLTAATSPASALLNGIPINGFLGIRIAYAQHGIGEACVSTTRKLRLGTGDDHPAGLVALIDACARAAMYSVIDEEHQLGRITPIASKVTLIPGAPAASRLIGRTELSSADVDAVRRLCHLRSGRLELTCTAEVRDKNNTVICHGTVAFALTSPADLA